jgi:hypothetical protein
MITPPTKNPSVASSAFISIHSTKQPSRSGSLAPSNKASNLLRKDSLWQKYKLKNEICERKHDEESQRAMSIKSRLLSKPDSNLMRISGQNVMRLNNTQSPTTIFDLPDPHRHADYGTLFKQPSHSVTKVNGNLPFPYLSGQFGEVGPRWGKRVVFDLSGYDNLLGQIVDQMNSKKERERNEKYDSRREE